MVDISAYHTIIDENGMRLNHLKQSLHLFQRIWFNRELSHVSVILFLNKYDQFSQKISNGQYRLQDYFPNYKKYKPDRDLVDDYGVDNEHPEITRAKLFILEMFIDITLDTTPPPTKSHEKSFKCDDENDFNYKPKRRSTVSSAGVKIGQNRNSSITAFTSKYKPSLTISYDTDNEDSDDDDDSKRKYCVPFFTCAFDGKNFERIYTACTNIVQKEYMEENNLL